MLALWIIGGILLLLLILLYIPLGVQIGFHNGQPSVAVVYGFLRFPINLEKKQQKPKEQQKKPSSAKKEKSTPKITSKWDKIKDEDGLMAALDWAFDQVKDVLDQLRYVLRRLVISPFHLTIRVGGEDAAATAITCGAVDAVIYPFAGWLCTAVDVRRKNIEVVPQYNGEYDLDFDTTVHLRPIYAIKAAVCTLIQYIKLNIKKEGA